MKNLEEKLEYLGGRLEDLRVLSLEEIDQRKSTTMEDWNIKFEGWSTMCLISEVEIYGRTLEDFRDDMSEERYISLKLTFEQARRGLTRLMTMEEGEEEEGDISSNLDFSTISPKEPSSISLYTYPKVQEAGSDWRSAIDVLKCVALIVNILTSASREEQSNYISAWSKMVSVCAQELRHGTSIWKQALQQNFQDQILSRPQGKKYVLALGEVYRVAKVLGSSAKLYMPWILTSSADSTHIFALISECSSLWSSSGLEEALGSILSSADFEYDVKTLLESIKYINDLDVQSLYNHVFSGQNPPCQLSALTAGLIPGMKTVAWNGNHCFLTLANLWANMVSGEPPNWPCIHVG